jgi:HAE1 family hydrophobic/amphiphilic exporter-1
METEITRPVEEAVSQVPNLYEIDSSSTLGQSSVRCQFNWGTNVDIAAVDTLQYAQRARQSFPQDPTNTLQVPLVYKYDPSSLPILIMGVSGINDPVRLRMLLDNTITPILESADGVAAAVATGGLPRAIIVNVDPTRLQAHNIPLALISSRISAENVSLPAGVGKQGNTEYTIQANGFFTDPDQIKQIPLGSFGTPPKLVTLGDVATVTDSHQEQRIYTRLNGNPAAGVIITQQSNANTVATTASVREKLKQVEKLYPELNWTIAYEQGNFITDSVNDLKNTAFIGGGLAIIILLMFLRNIRSTLVVALSIPISIISTFSLFYFAGFSLNTISLSGLALATGLIVDDAVVVLENIFRHIERDKRTSRDASIVGTAEISSAVLASTFTVMIVFFPLMMIQGQAGQTFTQFALVVIFSMAVSWLDAMTVVPMLCSRLISEHEVLEEFHPELRTKKPTIVTKIFDWFGVKFNNLDASYHRGLHWALKHRALVLLGAGGALLATFALIPFIGSELLPQTDTGNFTVNIKLPVGTALSVTNEDMKKVEKIILADTDVATEFSAAGTTLSLRGTTTAQIGYQGGATVTLKDDRKHSTQQNIVEIQKGLAKIPGILAIVTPYDIVTQILTGGATNMEVDVFGQDYAAVTKAAHVVQSKMQSIAGLDAVDLGVQESTPTMEFNIDRAKAATLGVSYNDIATAIDTSTNGNLASYYQELGFQYPIYVQVPEAQRKTGPQLMTMPITPSNANSSPSVNGSVSNPTTITLGQIAKPAYVYTPNQITRINRQRYIAVTGRVSPGRSESEIQSQITKSLDGVNLGNGIYWDYGTNQKRRGQEFAGLGLAVFMAIALIYIVLASQFESYVYPLIVLCSVPLCGIGVVLALFITGRNFSLTAFIGLLMLIGIAVKNGILLVDYTNQLRAKGMSRDNAIVTAGPTRLRPILMTSSAAILGMLPLALQLGKGSETEAPLATAVVGGLFTSTALTLFVVPVVYTLFDDLARRFRKDDRDLAPAVMIGPSVGATGHTGGERKEDGSDERTGIDAPPVGREFNE